MNDFFIQIALFASKTLVLFLFVFALLLALLVLIAKGREKTKGKLVIKNLNKKYDEMAQELLNESLPKKQLKAYLKKKQTDEKAKQKSAATSKNIYVLNFHGDIKASPVSALSEEITTILNVANKEDEVVLRLESAGGFVHGYGLAASQLMRLRAKQIPLTIAIDKMAASGGYLMACVGNKILAAPFAIIGSIGVLIQLPNFHRLLKDKHIDFVQLTAGEYKRTITMFGENSEAGREKLQQEIQEVHELFKNLIKENRPYIDINRVATGEHWLGQQALGLNLIDEIKTSDDYLFERSKEANLYEICYEVKKPFLNKLSSMATLLWEKLQFKQPDTLY